MSASSVRVESYYQDVRLMHGDGRVAVYPGGQSERRKYSRF